MTILSPIEAASFTLQTQDGQFRLDQRTDSYLMGERIRLYPADTGALAQYVQSSRAVHWYPFYNYSAMYDLDWLNRH